jgi:hypothetical protein
VWRLSSIKQLKHILQKRTSGNKNASLADLRRCAADFSAASESQYLDFIGTAIIIARWRKNVLFEEW